MNFRTDLALERRELLGKADIPGVESRESDMGSAHVTEIKITGDEGSQRLGKPKGRYITVEVPPFSDDAEVLDERLEALKQALLSLLPSEGLVLVAGLGNDEITPDSFGPKTLRRLIATRHITGEVARAAGLGELRAVAGIVPGVLGQTGIETGEIIKGVADCVKPSAVVVADALASRSLSRLGRTVQLSDTGICPGSGVGNRRAKIDAGTLGVPVISIGVPMVVDAATLALDVLDGSASGLPEAEKRIDPAAREMMVTPREIDLVSERAARLTSLALNCALQTSMSAQDVLALM
ncbi:MAG: GPR endopeptidase [Clostridiales bacterium]|nr:GPR endopeptidase [Clostridiales bacterium]